MTFKQSCTISNHRIRHYMYVSKQDHDAMIDDDDVNKGCNRQSFEWLEAPCKINIIPISFSNFWIQLKKTIKLLPSSSVCVCSLNIEIQLDLSAGLSHAGRSPGYTGYGPTIGLTWNFCQGRLIGVTRQVVRPPLNFIRHKRFWRIYCGHNLYIQEKDYSN
jgi:hypothetical protein